MDKEKIFLRAKKEMKHIVGEIEFNNLSNGTEQLKQYIYFLESLSKLEIPVLAEEEEDEEAEPIQVSEPSEGFWFERKLKGGYIPRMDTYVPEKIVRSLELTHGDIVKATPKKEAHFYFELIEKGKGVNPGRGEAKYCIVEKDGNLWVCNQTLSGKNIYIDDLPFTVHLKGSDIDEYHLKVGDIVDIAYSTENPTICKVIWKHQIEDEVSSAQLPSGTYKNKSKPNQQKVQEHPALKGKSITIIGNIDRYAVYRDRLSALGAKVEAMDGKENEERIASLIKRSDLVLIIIPAVSHQGSAIAKKYCKSYNVPFSMIDSVSINAVVSTAISRARKKTLFH